MEAAADFAIINGLAQAAKALEPTVSAGIELWRSEDVEKIKDALADLQASADVTRERVHGKLQEAAKRS